MSGILIVDDDVESVRALTQLLRESGHDEIRATHQPGGALQDAVEFHPRLIFVAIELPGTSGYELALTLHRHPHLRDTRLIALTRSAEHPGREHARTAGFERFLVKPVTAATLQKVLATPLQTKELP